MQVTVGAECERMEKDIMTTLKKDLIKQFSAMTTFETMKDSRLVLITSAGMIIGTAVPAEEADPAVSSMSRVTTELVRGYYKENRLPMDAQLDGDDGFFTLKNVTIESANTTANVPFMVVFFDQVIGVTIIGNE